MKIASYNVNGIRAALKKDLAGWLTTQNLDVLCVQETKAVAEQVDMTDIEAAGYPHAQWHSATSKKGYSGVMTLSKQAPDYVQYGIGMDCYDREGRVIRTDFGELTIFNCYFPNGGQGDERQAYKYRFLNDFLTHIVALKKTRPNILVVGDYNIAHEEIDIHAPKRNEHNSGFLRPERDWMTKWFDETGLVDTFRELHPEKTAYSWWSYRANARNNNKGWRIDYLSLSREVMDRVISVEHLKEDVHSDHCAVVLELAPKG